MEPTKWTESTMANGKPVRTMDGPLMPRDIDVPQRVGNVKFFAVSQNGASAMPINAEACEDPAELMRSCQAFANATRLKVVFLCETQHGTSRHTFYPDWKALCL